jgi:DNA helicase-2/ATP-dependent DNA helicase PcrA
MKLTEHQRRAIEHDGGNLQLIACAGSGKTEVVARRVVHLLTPGQGGRLAPRNIVAFTFTDKAAAELKERIITRCRETFARMTGLAEMFVGTIHAYCLELLKTEASKYLKYEVLNEVQQGLFVDRHSKRSGLTTSTDLSGAALKRYRDTPHYLAALAILRETEPVESALRGCSVMDGLEAYRALLDDRSYLDYSAILETAVDVMANEADLRHRLAERIRYVIVDEYQDVNPIQEAIVWLLHDLGAKVCVVGDDDQTIYQWRGSDVQNILTFAERYPGVDRVALEENFRSSQGVVETARAFIEQNAERLPKAMKPAGAQDYEPGDIIALSFSSPDEEAQHVASTMQALRGTTVREDEGERGISWSDMAVLLRSVKANGEPITRALKAEGIPFLVSTLPNREVAPCIFHQTGDTTPDGPGLGSGEGLCPPFGSPNHGERSWIRPIQGPAPGAPHLGDGRLGARRRSSRL